MRRGIRALMIDLAATAGPILALMMMVLLALVMPAQAQLPPEKPNLPVALAADKVEYDTATGQVIASGNVEIFYGERTLTADRIVYHSDTGRILKKSRSSCFYLTVLARPTR